MDHLNAPIAGVGAVVWKKDRVLLARRGHPPKAGSWSLPGGKQKLGETVQEAILREIDEEAGIRIRIVDIAAVVDLMDHDAQGQILYHYTVVDLVAEWVAGDIRAGDDAAEVAWVHPDNFDSFGLSDDVRRVIALAASKRLPQDMEEEP
ncbi:MAG: NUDIX hydrolase [Rhodospirillaceae bacterium]|nr:NUDIX hydrolase [Rhodospirillaceae bacterium]